VANGEYAPVNGLKLYYEVHWEGDDFLPDERTEAVTDAISHLLSARSQP
jgi:hypothetical protein